MVNRTILDMIYVYVPVPFPCFFDVCRPLVSLLLSTTSFYYLL